MNFMWTTPKVHCGTRVLALFEEKMLCPCIIHRSLHQSRYHLCLSDEFQMKFKGERFEYALLFDRGVIVMAPVELSYYYGYEAEQFSFYRIPKLLFTDSRFAGISTDAKLLYGVLLDRMSLSMKNGWHDNQGRVYIIFTLDDVAETLGCKTEKAIMNAVAHEVEEIDHPESSEGANDGYTERILHITITGKTAEEMAAEYGFTDQQLEMLQELLEEREMLADLVGSLMNVTADAKEVLLNLPEDLSPEREAVIHAACFLVGKVNYFWGGKSLVLGWDSRWGRLTEVTAAGSSTTGTYRPYGLDCSGFVDWVFYNATDGEYIIGHGGGAMAQHSYCTSITWAEAQIGDLVFYPEDTHVGIVCGWDESGNILIVHCAFSANNVVITGKEGFTTIGRPIYYGGA